MNFTLFYLGKLPSANSSTSEKIEKIRRGISPQMRNLFDYGPLKNYPMILEPSNEDDTSRPFNLYREVDGHPYTCLINEAMGAACRLSITSFETKGTLSVSNQIGDVDNKLKPLLDALSLPKSQPAQKAESKKSLETIHCLLEDDSLVWEINIQRKRLLTPIDTCESMTQIEVEVIPSQEKFVTRGIFGLPVF